MPKNSAGATHRLQVKVYIMIQGLYCEPGIILRARIYIVSQRSPHLQRPDPEECQQRHGHQVIQRHAVSVNQLVGLMQCQPQTHLRGAAFEN